MDHKLMSYAEALKRTSHSSRYLLLGNGFSVAWNSSIFSYRSLKENSSKLDDLAKKVFEEFSTADFELIIHAYEHAAKICKVHGIENDFDSRAAKIRDILIETIAENHPDYPNQIKDDEMQKCIDFLQSFSNIYTLNYDMLLYWVMMKDKFRDDGKPVQLKKISDGFAYNSEDFLNWDGSSFNVHYVHGALHLFEYSELSKLNYKNSNVSLKEQFMHLIKEEEKFPLFVSEGSSIQKLIRIRNSGYLTRCLNSLLKIGNTKNTSSMFTFGVSFSDNDSHIINCLGKNSCDEYYIGIYGDPNSTDNKKLITNAEKIVSIRNLSKAKRETNLFFYDAESAKVWR